MKNIKLLPQLILQHVYPHIISKGKKIVVPELENMKFSEVTKWLTGNNLKINYSDKYDNKVKSGNVISATYKKGDIIEEDTPLRNC